MKTTKLLELLWKNDIDGMLELLEKSPEEVNAMDSDGRTVLMEAALRNHIQVVYMLLQFGADPNIGDNTNYTALHFAAQEYAVDAVKALLKAGANVDAKDDYGNTPLGKAVYYNDEVGEVIKLLLDAGADKNLENNYGVSPIGLAKSIGNFDMVQFFPGETRD